LAFIDYNKKNPLNVFIEMMFGSPLLYNSAGLPDYEKTVTYYL